MLLYDGRATENMTDATELRRLIDDFVRAMDECPNVTDEERENYEEAMHSYARQKRGCEIRLAELEMN